MGTRNITKVISGGKLVCCQYGQWDGYPTITGAKVLEWIRKGDFDAIRGCTVRVAEDTERVYFTGAPATDEVGKVMKEHFNMCLNGAEMEDADKAILDKFGTEAFLQMKSSSRDTGADILSLVTEPRTLYSDRDCFEMEEPDGEIEAINIIDLDNRKVKMMWHEKQAEFTFDEISEMDIEAEMKAFESEEDDD